MKVMIMDDHQLVMDALTLFLEKNARLNVTPVTSRQEAIGRISRDGPYDCVLADLKMPGTRSAHTLADLVEANASKPVYLFSGAASFTDLYVAKMVGISGYIPKSMAVRDVSRLVQQILSNPQDVPKEAEISGKLASAHFLPEHFSEEDCMILSLLANGERNSEIATTLRITRSRVQTRIRAIYKAIGVSSRLAAATLVNNTNACRMPASDSDEQQFRH